MDEMRMVVLNDDVVPPGEGHLPFPSAKLCEGYALLFALARKQGLPLVLATDRDYGEGRLDRGWIHDGARWTAWVDIGVAAVYDQFPSTSPRGRLLVADLMTRGIPLFNHPHVTLVVDDKLLTWRNFPEIVPYTHYLRKGHDDIREVLHAFLAGCEARGWGQVSSFVAKMQVGWGGKNLFRFTQQNLGEIFRIPEGEYVLQPFLESSGGIPELGVRGRHDFRVILRDGHFVTAFVRQPARHDWIANYFDASEMIFVHHPEDMPADIMAAVLKADERMADYSPRLVSYDMARLSDGRVVCWEMNSRPGISPDSHREDDIRSSMALMNGALSCMAQILEQHSR